MGKLFVDGMCLQNNRPPTCWASLDSATCCIYTALSFNGAGSSRRRPSRICAPFLGRPGKDNHGVASMLIWMQRGSMEIPRRVLAVANTGYSPVDGRSGEVS